MNAPLVKDIYRSSLRRNTTKPMSRRCSHVSDKYFRPTYLPEDNYVLYLHPFVFIHLRILDRNHQVWVWQVVRVENVTKPSNTDPMKIKTRNRNNDLIFSQ